MTRTSALPNDGQACIAHFYQSDGGTKRRDLTCLTSADRDVAVLNAGLHYGIGATEAYTADLEFFTHFVEEHREDLPTLIWKDTPPQHFQYERGYFW